MLRSVLFAILQLELLVTQMSNAPYVPYPVQNSTLLATALAADLVRLYSFRSSVDCTFFRKGICDTYRVLTAESECYLKVYRHARLVGRMHRVLDSFPLPYRRQEFDLAHLIDENLDAIGGFMGDRLSDFQMIESIASEIRQLPLFSSPHQPEYGPCHRDLHGG